jgi:ornithine cyclodeaminase
MTMLILTKEDIKKMLPMHNAIEYSKEALRMYSLGQCSVPLRTVIDIPRKHGQCLFMPAYADDLNIAGIKIASVFPENAALNKPTVPAHMLLIDGLTGEVCAIMDGTYLTQLRTGALQGAATDILARRDAKTAVLFGTGGQAKTQLEAMLITRSLDKVHVFDIDAEKAQAFSAEMQIEFAHFNTAIVATTDINKAVNEADIITTITTSSIPVFDGLLVKQGAHINGIGAFTPDMQELPETIIQSADKIIFDTTQGVLAEAGDILKPIKKGLVSETDFDGELGELIIGRVKGRETDKEITLFKAVGSAVLDVVTAQAIYAKALASHTGRRIEI